MGEASDPDAAHRHAGAAAPQQMPDELAGRPIAGAVRALFAAAGIVATALAINQLLNLQLFAGIVFVDNRYLFLLAACLFPLIFIVFPARAGDAGPTPWYDWLIAATACALLLWFAYEAERILNEGWEYASPPAAKVCAAARIASSRAANRRMTFSVRR